MKPPSQLEIVGGGLAGLSLGLALQRAGISTTVIEAGTYPRHRVCGEFITGLAATTIEQLELEPFFRDALHHREVAWHIGDRLLRIQRLPAPALGISRYALDARLADAFVAAGGDLRTRTRCDVSAPAPGRVQATGRRRGRSDWIGLKVHTRDLPLTRDLELHLGNDAYVGLSRVEDGTVNVCGLFRRRPTGRASEPSLPPTESAPNGDYGATCAALFEHLAAASLRGLADRLARSNLVADSFCAVAALDFHRSPVALDRVCLGDAWAMIPPFTGNGMAMAFQSAALALAPLLRYVHAECTWNECCRTTHAALRSRFRVRLASAEVMHPFLLRPPRQIWLRYLSRARMLPFRPLYAALH